MFFYFFLLQRYVFNKTTIFNIKGMPSTISKTGLSTMEKITN